MQGIISALLLGSLAYANLTYSDEKTNLINGTKSNLQATLSGIFPSGNVPQSPKREETPIVLNSPKLGSGESQIRPPFVADNEAKSSSLINQQIPATQKVGKERQVGKIYSYQIPFNGPTPNNGGHGQRQNSPKVLESPPTRNNGELQLKPPSHPNTGVFEDNVPEDFEYSGGDSNSSKPGKKLNKNGKGKWLSKKNKKDGGRMQQVSASSYGNQSQIQGAGSGFHQVAHPQEHEHVLVQNHHHYELDQVLQPPHFNHDDHNQNQQIEVHPEQGHDHIYPHEPQHHIVYNGEHDRGQHLTAGSCLIWVIAQLQGSHDF